MASSRKEESVLRTSITRPLLIATTVAILLPPVAVPAQAIPPPLSSLSSAESLSSSLPDHPVDSPETEDEIAVDIPGYGPYTVSPEIQGTATGLGASQPDLLSAAAFSADYDDDDVARDTALAALEPERHAEVTAGLAALHSEVTPPGAVGQTAPIVVLGNGLNDDGSVSPNLTNRLQAARELSERRPEAPVVVSGGPTGHGHVESHAMRDWLLAQGVAEHRIIVENNSYSTVSNARLSRETLPESDAVIVVTSQDHVHRAVVDFTLTFGAGTTVAGAEAPNDPPTALPGTTGIYRDVMNWYLG